MQVFPTYRISSTKHTETSRGPQTSSENLKREGKVEIDVHLMCIEKSCGRKRQEIRSE